MDEEATEKQQEAILNVSSPPATRFAAEYLASIEPYRNGGLYEMPGEFVIAHAYKPGA